jgi:hypothetical protein
MSTWQAFFLGLMVAWTPTMVWLALALAGVLPEPHDWRGIAKELVKRSPCGEISIEVPALPMSMRRRV